MLAARNIRDLDAAKINPKPRLRKSLYYIAEIISAFDLVAVQEVSNNRKSTIIGKIFTAEAQKSHRVSPRWLLFLSESR